MSRWIKFGIVLAGYLLALALSTVVSVVYESSFTAEQNQTMGGMIAGGTMMLGGAVFLLASLVPTGLGLWFLRNHLGFWSAFSWTVFALSIVGLAAVLTPLVFPWKTHNPLWLDLVGFLSVIQMMGSPLWIGACALFAMLSPAPALRRRMLAAAAVEIAIAGCGIAHFLLPRPPF